MLDGIEQETLLKRKSRKKRPYSPKYVLFADSNGLLVWEKIELFDGDGDGDGVDDGLRCVIWIIECTR